MLRTFFAFDLDEGFLRDAAALADALRGERALSRARWVASRVMHMTLRFVGDTEPERVPALASALDALAGRKAVPVRGASLAGFSSSRRARVLALEIDDEAALAPIVADVESAVRALGFPPEERSYRPHLTLARLREPADLRRLVVEHPVSLSGRVTSVALYQSDLGPSGPTYTALARTDLS